MEGPAPRREWNRRSTSPNAHRMMRQNDGRRDRGSSAERHFWARPTSRATGRVGTIFGHRWRNARPVVRRCSAHLRVRMRGRHIRTFWAEHGTGDAARRCSLQQGTPGTRCDQISPGWSRPGEALVAHVARWPSGPPGGLYGRCLTAPHVAWPVPVAGSAQGRGFLRRASPCVRTRFGHGDARSHFDERRQDSTLHGLPILATI